MRILWCGDSPSVSTGFAKCTRFGCEALYKAGHEIHILGINEFGDPHNYPYKIYPCIHTLDGCGDPFGVGRLPLMIERVNPDLIVLLNDPWNVPAYFEQIDRVNEYRTTPLIIPPVIGWLAVDSKNQKGEQCNRLDHVMVWTEFAARELVKGGYSGSHSIVPLGVDCDLFKPQDRAECREKILKSVLPANLDIDNAFVVGVVGRNQPRKRLDLTLEYFAKWVHSYNVENAFLYLYVSPTGESGCDIVSLVNYYGLKGKVVAAHPEMGCGIDESYMPLVYGAFDVYLSTSQAEGFGLPSLESLACGVPCILPNYGGYDWAPDECALKVHCSSSALTAPLNAYPYTVGGVVDKVGVVGALQKMYLYPELRERMGRNGVEFARGMSWKEAGRKLVVEVEKVLNGQLKEVQDECSIHAQ